MGNFPSNHLTRVFLHNIIQEPDFVTKQHMISEFEYTDAKAEHLPENVGLVRRCESYDEEYKACSGFRRLYRELLETGHVYTKWTGLPAECDQWAQCADLCHTYREHPASHKGRKALEKLVAVEEAVLEARIKSAREVSSVWTLREAAPSDWNQKLVPDMAARAISPARMAEYEQEHLKMSRPSFHFPCSIS